MQARYYDPVIGRFLSIDPVGFTPTRPSMFNRYAYAANDPVNLVDPFGTDSIQVQFKDQKIRLYKDGPVIPQALSGGHSGIVVINQTSGLTRYREFGRYNGDSQVRSKLVPDLKYADGIPTQKSVETLLKKIIEIGRAAGSDEIEIVFSAGSDFDKMMAHVAEIIKDDPDWSVSGPNCHTFCKGTAKAGDATEKSKKLTLTSENVAEVATIIVSVAKEATESENKCGTREARCGRK
jgi:uncharacterized protein RhaS with RHS repeats